MTVPSAGENSVANEECRLLRELQATPSLFEQIRHAGGSELALQSILRRQYPDDLVRMAISLHQLRQRARAKFSRAEQMWFDRQGLEQSTAELVSRYKARRFQGAVWDLCCGIGSDTISLGAHCEVIAVDIHSPNCLRTEWNARTYEVAERIETRCIDVRELTTINNLVHIDPDRRPNSGGRVSRIEDYVPGLEFLQELMGRSRGGAIKVSPASNFGGKFPDAEIELISLHGECKEATVWFGELASDDLFRATVLPAGESISGHPLEVAVPISALGQFLYDPDPSVVRAGLVDVLAHRLGLSRLDSAEEYLTSDQLIRSPFLQPFEVLAKLPNNEKELKAWLRNTSAGSLEIKCRHIPIQADTLRRRLPLDGSEPRVAVFARLDGKARIVGARRVANQS